MVVNDLNPFWTSTAQAVAHHGRVRRDTVTERHPLWLSTTPSATILPTASGLDRRTLLRGSSPSRRGSLGIPRVLCASAPQTDPQLSPQASDRATPSRDPANASFRNNQTLNLNSTTLRTSRMSHKVTTLARHHSRALVWSHNHIPRRSFVSLWAGGRRRSRWDKPECNVYPG